MFGAWEPQGILHKIPVRLRREWQYAQRPDTFRTSDIKIAGGGAGFGMSEISAMRIEGLIKQDFCSKMKLTEYKNAQRMDGFVRGGRRMERKKLPVGIDSFEKLRREAFYYVDKTGLIIDLLNNWGEVNLFTRPRRFGKTLNMSMLKSFFEIGADRTLFDGLAISRETALCEAYMGRFPVVFVSLKGVDGLTFEDAYGMLRRILRSEVFRLSFLAESKKVLDKEKAAFERFLNEQDTLDDVQESLKMLSSLL